MVVQRVWSLAVLLVIQMVVCWVERTVVNWEHMWADYSVVVGWQMLQLFLSSIMIERDTMIESRWNTSSWPTKS